MISIELKYAINDICFLEIQKDGRLVSPQNPVTIEELQESDVEYPEFFGIGCVISGMPAWLADAVALHYKNHFSFIALYYKPLNVGIVVHSTNRDYPRWSTVFVE